MKARALKRHLKEALEGMATVQHAIEVAGSCGVYQRSLRHWQAKAVAWASRDAHPRERPHNLTSDKD